MHETFVPDELNIWLVETYAANIVHALLTHHPTDGPRQSFTKIEQHLRQHLEQLAQDTSDFPEHPIGSGARMETEIYHVDPESSMRVMYAREKKGE